MQKAKEITVQVPRKIPGYLEAREGDEYLFTPQRQTGESTQQNVVTAGKSKMYDTIGKKPMRVIHLNLKGDTPDLKAAAYDEIDKLMKDTPSETKRPESRVCIRKSVNSALYINEVDKTVEFECNVPIRKAGDYVNGIITELIRVSPSLQENREKIVSLIS